MRALHVKCVHAGINEPYQVTGLVASVSKVVKRRAYFVSEINIDIDQIVSCPLGEPRGTLDSAVLQVTLQEVFLLHCSNKSSSALLSRPTLSLEFGYTGYKGHREGGGEPGRGGSTLFQVLWQQSYLCLKLAGWHELG